MTRVFLSREPVARKDPPLDHRWQVIPEEEAAVAVFPSFEKALVSSSSGLNSRNTLPSGECSTNKPLSLCGDGTTAMLVLSGLHFASATSSTLD